MPFSIHFTKALVLAGLLALAAIFTFNKIIQNNRLEIFHKYSQLILPPGYEIKQNTAGPGNYRTDVLMVFQFDQTNYNLFLKQNKIESTETPDQNKWVNQNAKVTREIKLDTNTRVWETIHQKQKSLTFRFVQE